MIPSLAQIAYGIFGAWRLAHLDEGGLRYFDATPAGFWRSFFAAVIAAPGFAILVALTLSHREITADPLSLVLIEGLGYVISWLIFPLVMASICDIMGKPERFALYIVANNWAQIIVLTFYLPVFIFVELGPIPYEFGGTVRLVAYAIVLVYLWYIAKAALRTGGASAAAIVIMGQAIDFFLAGIIDARLY